jgi:ATP-binding cassette subfamily B protein
MSVTQTPSGRGGADNTGWIFRLIGLCRANRLQAVLVTVSGVVAAGAVVSVPILQKLVVDDGIIAHRYSVFKLSAGLLIAGAVSYVATYLRRYAAGRLSLDVQHDLRNGIFRALSDLDGARQDELQTGPIVARGSSDLATVQWFVGNIPLALSNVLLFVTSFVIMLWLSPLLTLIALAVGPGLLWIALLARKKLFPATWEAGRLQVPGSCGWSGCDRLGRLTGQARAS